MRDARHRLPLPASVRAIGLAASLMSLGLALGLASPPTALADQYASITDAGYQPPQITIHAGESITWVNTGSLPHSITADDGSFDSGPIAPGDRYGNTFTEVGTFNVHSGSDPSFRGQIVVLGITDGATPTSGPAQSLPIVFGSPSRAGPAGGLTGDSDPAVPIVAVAGTVLIGAAAAAAQLRRRRTLHR